MGRAQPSGVSGGPAPLMVAVGDRSTLQSVARRYVRPSAAPASTQGLCMRSDACEIGRAPKLAHGRGPAAHGQPVPGGGKAPMRQAQKQACAGQCAQ